MLKKLIRLSLDSQFVKKMMRLNNKIKVCNFCTAFTFTAFENTLMVSPFNALTLFSSMIEVRTS